MQKREVKLSSGVLKISDLEKFFASHFLIVLGLGIWVHPQTGLSCCHVCDKRSLEMKYDLNNDDMSKLAQPLGTLEFVRGLEA
jgi:hypothetical protein